MNAVSNSVVKDSNETTGVANEDDITLLLDGLVCVSLERLLTEELSAVEDGDEDVLGAWLLEDPPAVPDGWLLPTATYP